MLKVKLLFTLVFLLAAVSACSSAGPTAAPTPMDLPTLPTASVPVTVIVEPTIALPPINNLPQDDAAVPRVSVDQAKAAFDSGDAVIVDVRGPNSYARGHIAGALEISVSAIITDPSKLPLDKNKWIITYCT